MPRVIVYIGLLISFVVGILVLHGKENSKTMNTQPTPSSSGLSISSQAFAPGAEIPATYTCKGKNVNPPLNISGMPEAAKSLVLVLHDPDGVGGDFVHWVVWNIPVSAGAISENSLPVGAAQGQNGGGQNKYMGPCPPAGTGTHHYLFELYSLDKTLSLKPDTDRDQLQKAMQGHILSQATLTGLFSTQ